MSKKNNVSYVLTPHKWAAASQETMSQIVGYLIAIGVSKEIHLTRQSLIVVAGLENARSMEVAKQTIANLMLPPPISEEVILNQLKELACGGYGCLFWPKGERQGGLRPNGGCQCLPLMQAEDRRRVQKALNLTRQLHETREVRLQQRLEGGLVDEATERDGGDAT